MFPTKDHFIFFIIASRGIFIFRLNKNKYQILTGITTGKSLGKLPLDIDVLCISYLEIKSVY